MSDFTTEVRFICENYSGLTESIGYKGIDDVLTKAIPKVFDFDFPIFDEAYRTILEKKILKHYYTREIGEESVGLWKLRLDTKLNEIMPYYNKLYNSELIEFNPLYNHDLERAHQTVGKSDNTQTTDMTNTGNTSNLSSANAEQKSTNVLSGNDITNQTKGSGSVTVLDGSNINKDAYSDTPQGQLSNVENNSYLTNYRKVDDKTDNTTTVTTNGTDSDVTILNETRQNNDVTNNNSRSVTDNTNTSSGTVTDKANTLENYLEHVVGYSGSNPNEMLEKYRKNFLNIDMSIIKELEPLFFQLW